jgi:hypothetical protein
LSPHRLVKPWEPSNEFPWNFSSFIHSFIHSLHSFFCYSCIASSKGSSSPSAKRRRGKDISSYWMTLRKKREDTEKWKRKHQIALGGELALEDAARTYS